MFQDFVVYDAPAVTAVDVGSPGLSHWDNNLGFSAVNIAESLAYVNSVTANPVSYTPIVNDWEIIQQQIPTISVEDYYRWQYANIQNHYGRRVVAVQERPEDDYSEPTEALEEYLNEFHVHGNTVPEGGGT